jgi:hypothetical protein
MCDGVKSVLGLEPGADHVARLALSLQVRVTIGDQKIAADGWTPGASTISS